MTEHLKLNRIQYLLHYPEGFDKSKKYPLILFLHGSGTRGTDISVLEEKSSFVNLCKYKNHACIVAEPQCCAVNWNELMSELIELTEQLRGLDFVDEHRIYLTGNSMGGYGTWELATLRPWFFAAIMPLCGGGIPWHAYRLKTVPVYAFHGILDNDVLPEESLKMVRKVNLSGGYAHLTLFPDIKHNCWDRVYGDSEMLDKLFEHASSGEVPDFSEFTGENYG